MADSYVTSGATMKCSCGDKTAKLTVYPDRTVYLTEKPMANISDHVPMYNIASFGKCRTTSYPPTGSATAANHGCLTPMPCVPGTNSNWLQGKSDYIIKGKPALLKSSYCKCQWGGIITITDDGQTDTGDADLNRVALQSEEEWTAEELEKEGLTPENILDGMQTVLDVAGFFPGLGAIPDLLNAAIYALRGDMLNAGLSVIAAVPGVGDAAAGAKLVGKGIKAAKIAKNASKISKEQKTIAKKYISRNVTQKELLKEKGVTPNNVDNILNEIKNERREFARNFYEKSGHVKKSQIDSHLCGIDFSKPVKVKKVPPPDVLYQYQSRDIKTYKRARGSYYTPDKNAKPTDLGINERFALKEGRRENKKYHVEIYDAKPQDALQSTAAPIIDNWSVPGKPYETRGGGVQFYMPLR